MADVQAPPLTLGEGNTPLIRSRSIGPGLGLECLYFKLETTNPTGSFKDRFACAGINHMLASGKSICIATSCGNTGAALAAYCAAAKISCNIAIVETAPIGKLKQMLSYGACLYRVRGFGLDPGVTTGVFEFLHRMAGAEKASLQISAFKYSPVGMAGVRSLADELAEQLPGGMGHVFCQAGGGGLCVAVAERFLDLRDEGRAESPARVHCVQPEGNNTIAGPLREGKEKGQDVTCTSKISGLQVASVIDADRAIRGCRATGGTGYLVSDQKVFEAQAKLAREEGVSSEPAGATALAGAIAAAEAGELDPASPIVCLVTGMGFKDEASLDRMVQDAPCPLLDGPGDLEKAILRDAGI